MEGLEATETYLSKLENFYTLGSEYYSPLYSREFQILQQSHLKLSKLISECELITDGDHGSAEYVDNGVLFIMSESVKNGWIDLASCRQISKKHASTLTRSKIKTGDVLVSKTGVYFGKSAVATIALNGANTIAHVGIIRPKNTINPYYLSTFFNGKYGYSQLRRRGIKATRPEIKLLEFNDITIAIASNELQETIESILKKSQAANKLSNTSYTNAESSLLKEIGVNKYHHSDKNINIKSLKESFLQSERLDSEYYQAKYDELEAKIAETHTLGLLRDFVTINQRGTQPNYAEEGLPVINSKHVREGEVLLSDDNRFAILPDKDDALTIKKGDVLINGTGVGTIGRSAPYLHEQEAIPDNHVTILRTHKIDPIFLSVYLNSIAGKYQVEKYFKGSSGQIELYPTDIGNFYVPIVESSIQIQIADFVRQSFTLKAKSEQLLEAAKRAVEIAIEDSEEAAMHYLEPFMQEGDLS